MKASPWKKYLTILALSISGGSIYCLPFIKYVFYDTQIEVMGITNTQSGFLMTMYAIGCTISYIPGGLLADKISPRKSIVFSLLVTACLGMVYAMTFSYTLALALWLMLAISTAFVFWASLMKAIGLVGDSDEQARLYGLYYAGNGITGAVVNSLALEAFTLSPDPKQGFFNAIAVMCTAMVAGAVMVWFLVGDKSTATSDDEKFDFSVVGQLVKSPMLWSFSFIVFAGYAIFSSTSYFTPYLTNVVGLSVEESGAFSIIRSYLFYLLSPFAGYLADRVIRSTSKLFIILFAILGLLIAGVMHLPEMSTFAISVYTLLPGAVGLMLYGLVFSVVREAGIPTKVAGTAIGVASIIGYSPDFFFSAMFGNWLDTYGNGGYELIFYFLSGVCVLGMLASVVVYKRSIRERVVEAVPQEA